MTSVPRAARLDEQQFDLVRRVWLVLDAFRHDEQLARPNGHRTIPKVDAKLSFEHEKGFVSLGMIVPHEIALDPCDLELIDVQLGHHARTPLFGDRRGLRPQGDRCVRFDHS